jgi:hypothetical protein
MAALGASLIGLPSRVHHRYLLHPRGVKFTGASVASDSPTNAGLEIAAN